MNALHINRRLEDIGQKVHKLRDNGGAQEDLRAILRITQAMQVELTSARIMGGYRTDAINQMLRVRDLIEEAGPDPDHRQMLSIGMAAELAVKKMHDYREMLGFEARTRAAGGEDDGLVELAA